MTVTAKALVEAIQAPAADTTLYTAPLATRTIIDKLTGTNVSAGAVTLTVNLVPAAGAAGAANAISQAKSIAAGDSYTFPEIVGHVLNPGDILSVKASAGASINVRASGREIV
jgi:hypothetical protein